MALALEGMYRSCRNGDVIKNARHGLPERQRQHLLRIDRHDDRVTRLDLSPTVTEPEAAVTTRHDTAIGAYHINVVAIGFRRQSAAEPNVCTARQVRIVQEIGHVLSILRAAAPKPIEIISVPERQRPNDRPYLCPDVARLKRLVGSAASPFDSGTAKRIFAELLN